MSKAHIWADQLKNIINEDKLGAEIGRTDFDTVLGTRRIGPRQLVTRRQRDYRQMKVRRVCEDCNGGWMRELEERAIEIAKPMITGNDSILFGNDQKIVATWLTMMTMLMEFLGGPVTIPIRHRVFLKNYLQPPDGWIISIGKCTANTRFNWGCETMNLFRLGRIGFNAVPADNNAPPDTHVTTFRVGYLLVQTFSSPKPPIYQSYDVFVKNTNLRRIWPVRRHFGMFGIKEIHWDRLRDLAALEIEQIAREFGKRFYPRS